jgi:MFS family permease
VSWSDPLTIASLVAAAVTTPMFVLAELRTRTPMIELTLFRDRSFSALTAASFLGGLSRFALTFLFVLYFQGAPGDDPILAGAKLAPLAVGMLVASPIAGRHADARRGRVLAVAGMLVSAAGMALMTLMTVDTAYWVVAILLAIVGVGIGMFQSPNATAMMQSVPEHRRGVAAGVRMVLQNAGAVLSLAVVLAVVTSAVPRDVLLSIFSGLTSSPSPQALDPFIHNLHVALWILVASALCGAAASFMRPSDRVAVGSLAQERRSEGKASV